ncbi:zinc transporter ZIP6 [Nilaparvata lugens]|uniref:zinc transporter ZIP6 n=1 Tax=Nilaparvata lugens TaxID=108931 RepID=UPI00193DF45B|nr:zinc transporter ZIP6 [Nilaparvata lugens]
MMSNIEVMFILTVCTTIVTSTSNVTQVNNDSPAETFFLDYLFNKYGNNGKISYEGFEHLLDSLGLGQLKFSHELDKHRINNGSFEEVHDKLNLHTHNHLDRRRRSPHNVEKSKAYSNGVGNNLYKKDFNHCYTPEEMLMIYKLEPNHQLGLSRSNFLHICPVLVFQLDKKSCVPGRVEEHPNSVLTDTYIVWTLALLSVFVISLAGLIGISLVPFLQRFFFEEILGFLMALAVGTLCGDALLHLLPHAFQMHEDEDPNNVTYRAAIVFLSILIFFVIGNFMHSHGHTHEESSNNTELALNAMKGEESGQFLESSHTHAGARSNMNVAYMVIMGDGLHNLTDGLAIGAAFAGDVVSGITTAIAVLTHELPHELGDFAVLLKTGMTVKQAVFYNIVSSVMSLIGVVIGLMLTNLAYASSWIYSITAGVFLYIALVNLVPELKKSTENTLSSLSINVAGLIAGAGIMFLIAIYEHDLEHLLGN